MIENVACKESRIPCDPELVDSIESAVWFFAHRDEWQFSDCCDIAQTAVEILLQRESLWRNKPGSISYRLYQDASERFTRLQLDKLTIGSELPDCSENRRQYLPTEKESRADRMIEFRAQMIRRNRRQMTEHFAAWIVETIDDAITEMDVETTETHYQLSLKYFTPGPFRFPFILSCRPHISHQTEFAACCELVATID